MDNDVRDDRQAIYEIGYLLAGLPEEKVAAEAAAVTSVITKAGGVVIAEEAPKSEHLAYTMRKKTVSGSYDKYDTAYFGWVKFEANADKIDSIKKAIEAMSSILRILITTTVRENTYLGKRAPAIAVTFVRKPYMGGEAETLVGVVEAKSDTVPVIPVTPASIEEMDKSIDDMVKEV